MVMPPTDCAAGPPFFGRLRSLRREVGDFRREVLQRSYYRLVLAEFWAPWCGACAHLRTALEGVRARDPGRFRLASVNIEMQPALVGAQRVHGLPLVKAYWRGRAVGEIAGVLPPPQIEKWLDSLVLEKPVAKAAARR